MMDMDKESAALTFDTLITIEIKWKKKSGVYLHFHNHTVFAGIARLADIMHYLD
jgi:hypothetical protein